uniref:DUF4220 domain-containing protein n=1 Tax=Triticum urartu TaxID=4572 RepID=A0A8R7P7R6_TRIUA
MVGRLAAARARPGQPGPSVVPPAGCPHAQVRPPARLEDVHLAGVYFQRSSGNLRAGHPLQYNRHAKTSNFGGDTGREQQSSILEVLWAPILLIYLGGQEGMSGYEIEDNKLWGKHTVTLVSQVAVALYAFYKSWPRSNDPKLLVVAVLLFVVGVISFSQKPWDLKAKARRLAAVSSGMQGPKKPSNWRERMNQFFFGASHCFTGTRKAQSNFSTNFCLAICRLAENTIWVSRFFAPLISASRFMLLVFLFLL